MNRTSYFFSNTAFRIPPLTDFGIFSCQFSAISNKIYMEYREKETLLLLTWKSGKLCEDNRWYHTNFWLTITCKLQMLSTCVAMFCLYVTLIVSERKNMVIRMDWELHQSWEPWISNNGSPIAVGDGRCEAPLSWPIKSSQVGCWFPGKRRINIIDRSDLNPRG